MEHTENYQLSLWEQDDLIQMEDFNADNEKIAAALKAQAENISALQSGKANSATVGALTTRVADLEAGKADQTALEAEIAARAAQFAAIAANLGAAGHNCRIAFGSYAGGDTYGANGPTEISCDFYPILVIVGIGDVSSIGNSNTSAVLVRGMTKAYTTSTSDFATLTWRDNGVSIVSTKGSTVQLNHKNNVYPYMILGYDNAAEPAAGA